MKNVIYPFILLLCFLASCGNTGNNQTVFKEYISPDGNYKVSIPADLNKDSRSRSDFMAFTSDGTFIYITKEANYSLDEKTLKVNQEGDPYVFNLVETTDSTKLYKYTKGLLVIYGFYLIKRMQGENFLISIESSRLSRSRILETGFKVYSSLVPNNEIKAVGNTVKEVGTSMKTYRTDAYSIQYPATWIVTENLDELTDFHIGSDVINIGFTMVNFPTDASLDEILNIGDSNMTEAGYDIVAKQNLQIDGVKAVARTYFIINKDEDLYSDNRNISIISYMFKKGDEFYNIKFGNCFHEEEEKIANTIIKTFKFLK